ncbi:MAG TPA: hypothetical protein ENG83_02205 [Nitrospirae bacterium]|nr:thermophilic serine proteinase precursor [bacterium BMS3Abin06]HDH11013.1 hypothetical protein [Nitrospirota bacterium]HDZ01298.1 hypothetical protein [Nitrospirota bacterium]
MKRIKRIALIIAIGLVSLAISHVDVYSQERPEYLPGELLVKFQDGVSGAKIKSLIAGNGAGVVKRIGLIDLYHLKLPSSLSVERALTVYRNSPLVKYAEPNYLRYPDIIPNDPSYPEMWGLDNTGQTGGTADADIDAPEAWDITTGGPDVVVAVIDSGMDLNHEDLAANLYTNPGEIAGNGIDDDGNGYIDDVNGWDFAWDDNDPTDTDTACGGHGTHTSGTIGAVGDNGIGVTGINWDVRIMPLKIFRTYFLIFCSASSSDIISAIEYASMMGVRVSNNSYGSTSYSQAEYDAIQASRSVFVAAAGNDGANTDVSPQYPSAYDLDNIISVAATDDDDLLAYFSNYGTASVDLAAPGVSILSTLPGDTYDLYDGTSMATPHVVGVTGLLLSQDPALTVNEMKWRILNGTDSKGLPVLTQGRLNANNTLGFGLALTDVTVIVTPLGPTTVSPGDTINYNVALTNNTAFSKTVEARVFVQLPDGSTVDLEGPGTFILPANGTIDQDFSRVVPSGVNTGTYTLFGQAESTNSFDEDPVDYEVVRRELSK